MVPAFFQAAQGVGGRQSVPPPGLISRENEGSLMLGKHIGVQNNPPVSQAERCPAKIDVLP
jgi:hypothetical protein